MTYTIEDKSLYHHYSHNNVHSPFPNNFFLPILMVVNALLNCFLNQLNMRQRKRTKEKLNGRIATIAAAEEEAMEEVIHFIATISAELATSFH